MKKVLYFDTETTGTNPAKHGIIQFAAIVEVDGEEKERVNIKMKPHPTDEIDPTALQVNGITTEMLENEDDRLSCREGYAAICAFLSRWCDKYDRNDKYYPAGYNVRFDLDMLAAFFRKNGDNYFGSYINWKVLDPMPILHMSEYAGNLAPLENFKLSTVCNHFNIPINAHDALSDIDATRRLLKLVLGGYAPIVIVNE